MPHWLGVVVFDCLAVCLGLVLRSLHAVEVSWSSRRSQLAYPDHLLLSCWVCILPAPVPTYLTHLGFRQHRYGLPVSTPLSSAP
jgi:hypothetical protein